MLHSFYPLANMIFAVSIQVSITARQSLLCLPTNSIDCKNSPWQYIRKSSAFFLPHVSIYKALERIWKHSMSKELEILLREPNKNYKKKEDWSHLMFKETKDGVIQSVQSFWYHQLPEGFSTCQSHSRCSKDQDRPQGCFPILCSGKFEIREVNFCSRVMGFKIYIFLGWHVHHYISEAGIGGDVKRW